MGKGLVRIRLARFGRRHSPVYNIVVANAHKATTRKPIEVIGTYDPIPSPLTREEVRAGVVPTKDIQLDFDRAKYWIGVGAQPSETVTRLLKKCGILPPEWGRSYSSTKVVEPVKEVVE
ncbi:AGL013Wp [Eremothecium gossypii ATCC 10895]|uniref:AGL013Wp n=1 Tax=Eremothecium gossypii (strain ATCC 10895 / CBS 109.51 / FGSC 9923 / NRRL Y-1056) TaxID=284811 RepID=Q750G6_EREGS|nr:mitochondrial 37S ribosomal protein MRPS16 [Eremothecium gossypii ATCC 10895]AAS54477.2 AGL013Wp [Eremothecium gossypii ATCC 10895]AEY98809.1 FAGL013Wp [Eremothecium gossypii FDAG1]